MWGEIEGGCSIRVCGDVFRDGQDMSVASNGERSLNGWSGVSRICVGMQGV